MLLAGLIGAGDLPPRPAWEMLPPVPLAGARAMPPEVIRFVAGEVAAGRCTANAPGRLAIDVALLLDGENRVTASVPRAIGCPVIEQFAAGVAIRWVRGNLLRHANRMGWYRLHLDFDWTQ